MSRRLLAYFILSYGIVRTFAPWTDANYVVASTYFLECAVYCIEAAFFQSTNVKAKLEVAFVCIASLAMGFLVTFSEFF